MALAFEISSTDGLEDGIKSLYVEKDGKFRLDLTGFDPADELKEALAKERGLNKDLKAKSKQLEEASKEAEKKRATENNEFESLYGTAQADLDNERKANSEYRANIQQKDISSSALKIALALTKDTSKAELLQEKISGMSRYKDGVIKFEIGGIEVDSKKVSGHLTERFPFLVDGSQASGGGASGGSKSGGAAKEVTRENFDNMSQLERSKFAVAGGKVI